MAFAGDERRPQNTIRYLRFQAGLMNKPGLGEAREQVWVKNIQDRVGAGVTPGALPHHRTYGSVYGGSCHPLLD
jgi:hypothetical protein